MSTVALVRDGRGMDFNRYVERVFRDKQSAHKWANTQYRNVNIVVLEDTFRKGQAIPMDARSHRL